MLALLRVRTPHRGRFIAGILALLWLWVAWSFLWTRYATINWAASWLAGLFLVEALLLIWIGVVGGRLHFAFSHSAAGVVGGALFLAALLLYPALAALLGRPWRQAEVFGIAPDPTVLGTLGLLLLAEGRRRWALDAIPLACCAIGAATLWALATAA
jgi:hypothetical protein